MNDYNRVIFPSDADDLEKIKMEPVDNEVINVDNIRKPPAVYINNKGNKIVKSIEKPIEKTTTINIIQEPN